MRAGARVRSEDIDTDMVALSGALLAYASLEQHFHGPFTKAVFSSGGHESGQINKFPHNSLHLQKKKMVYSAQELLALKKRKYTKEQLLAFKKQKYTKDELLEMKISAGSAESAGWDLPQKKKGDVKGLFELRSIIEGPVSWNSKQQLYLHVKERK